MVELSVMCLCVCVCVCVELPDSPSNVSVVEESSTWVRLSAEAPRRDGGMPVSHWSINYELATPHTTTGHSTDTGHTSGHTATGHSSSSTVSRLFTDGTSLHYTLVVCKLPVLRHFAPDDPEVIRCKMAENRQFPDYSHYCFLTHQQTPRQ